MKKSKKLLAVLICLTLVIGLLAGCTSAQTNQGTTSGDNTGTTQSSDDQVYKFKFNIISKELKNHPPAETIGVFIDEAKKNNDKIEWDLYLNGTLGTTVEAVLGGLQNENFQFADWATSSFAEMTDTFLPIDMPYLFLNQDVANACLEGELGDFFTEKCIAETGIRPLVYLAIGFRHVTTAKTEVKTPEDLKGLKIRTQSNPLHIAGFKAFGAAPTAIAYAELFTSLQQGVVDAQENPVSNIVDQKFYEVQKYLTTTGHLYTTSVIATNDEVYQSWPDDIRKAIDDAAATAQKDSPQRLAAKEDALFQTCEDNGMTIIKLSADELAEFQEVAQSASSEYKEIIGADYYNEVMAIVTKITKQVTGK